jgi:hypothetical protein
MYLVNTTDMGPACFENIYRCRKIKEKKFIDFYPGSNSTHLNLGNYKPECESCYTDYPELEASGLVLK